MSTTQRPTSPVHANTAQVISNLSPTSGPARSSLSNGTNGVAPGQTVELDLTGRIQIVDEEKKFTTGLGSQLENWLLIDVGFAYNIVAVFGSQSTGKSTLLNRLFGTTFDVMDETRRQQTTKGIWVCRSTPPSPLLVMDVEGTDGRERGEDQDFERKSALFSLASSEILIVNMWEHQVGLYHGANMALLKTVFEVNLTLFGKREGETSTQRTLLLFVIRDYVGATPLANLQATLTADMLRIWEGLTKPQGLQGARMEEYFDMEFVALPHKILVPEKFEEAVGHLRLRFTDVSTPGFLFKPVYHKRIPADGVEHYMRAIWEQVQSNKDLDLPTQQELLAQFRCDEIAAVAVSKFLSGGVKDVRKVVERGDVVEGLGAVMAGWRDGAITHFDHAASRYHKQVYQRKRADLLKTIHTTLHPLFYNQLKNLSKLTVIRFKKALGAGLKGEGYDFTEVVHHAREVGVESFERGAREALLSEAEEWSFDEELAQLEVEMKSVADVFRKDETTKMINGVERMFKTQLTEPVDLALNKPGIDMWDRVLIGFNDLIGKAEATYTSRAAAFNCTEEETFAALGTLRKRAWLALIAKVKEHTADAALLGKLRASFEDSFRYDANGVPRVWKPEDDIDGVFKKARDTTLDLIPLYAKISPTDKGILPDNVPSDADAAPLPGASSTTAEEYDFDASLLLLSETKQLDITSRFRRDSDAYYVEAKRSTVSSVAQIPIWMYGVLIVLGWNEAMVILFNPLYFTFLLICLTGAYVVFQLGLIGPIMSIGRTVLEEVQNQATSKLREHFSQPQLAAPIAARLPPRQGSTYTTNSTLVDEAEDEMELRDLTGQVR